MWVLAENGQLINLDRFYAVSVDDYTGHTVVARSENDFVGSVVLCSCDDKEHGREIIRRIADALANGDDLFDIRYAKVYVYFCDVCDQRFEVPWRDDKVHFLRGNVVCPDCWAAEQAKAAT